MTIYEVLKSDHKLLRQWLTELETEAAASDVEGVEPTLTPTFDMFSSLLTAHSKAEEKVLYERLKNTDETSEEACGGQVEHHLADKLVHAMKNLDRGTREWNAHFKVLKEMVEHHIKEEESVLFKKAKSVLENDEEERLGEEMEKHRGTIPDNQT